MGNTTSYPLELKSAREIDRIRRAGRILARVLREVSEAAVEGVTTLELDRMALARIKESGGKPAFLGLYGFPNTLCMSINEMVVHGIPSRRKLEKGDLLSIDCGVAWEGYFADGATSVAIGTLPPRVRDLMTVTRECLDRGLAQCHVGHRLGDIGWAVQSHAEAHGFHVIKGYCGHGVGRHPHEEPQVENTGKPGEGRRLLAGMVIAVEPMIALGTGETRTLRDDWTVVTADKSPAAHFEHTIAIGPDGPEVLTRED